MTYRSRIGTFVLIGVLGAWACHDTTSSQSEPLVLSASSRGISLREDSLRVVADSATVSVSGAGSWTATHGGGTWLTLTTSSGTGSGVVRWRRDATVLTTGFSYVDTITVTLQGAAGATASLVDSVTVRSPPAQFMAVPRAWRPGERDSVAAYILRTRAMDDFSDVAAQALAQEDSAVDVILNPAWHQPAGTSAAGVQLAPQFASGWGARGLDILLVFDSVPGGTVQRDSLMWKVVRWWNPADSTWKGWMIHDTAVVTFAYDSVNTVRFDSLGGHGGTGGGEARMASGTYWQANSGQYRITSNTGYGTFAQLTGGPYLGGDYAVGKFRGRLNLISMPRVLGSDAPDPSTFTFDFGNGSSQIPVWQIKCYFPPITPVSPYHACTGQAAAQIVAAAREHRLTAATLAGVTMPILNEVRPKARSGGRRMRR